MGGTLIGPNPGVRSARPMEISWLDGLPYELVSIKACERYFVSWWHSEAGLVLYNVQGL